MGCKATQPIAYDCQYFWSKLATTRESYTALNRLIANNTIHEMSKITVDNNVVAERKPPVAHHYCFTIAVVLPGKPARHCLAAKRKSANKNTNKTLAN